MTALEKEQDELIKLYEDAMLKIAAYYTRMAKTTDVNRQNQIQSGIDTMRTHASILNTRIQAIGKEIAGN